MQAREATFLKLLDGQKQFIIPIFQRTYSWKEKQCEQLWNDIVRVATNESVPAHFIGSIVYIEHGLYQPIGISQLLVIDGQQRLTTLMLLLAAVGEAIDKSGEKLELSRQKIGSLYLFNRDEEGDKRFKLLLTRSDKETLLHLLEGAPLPNNPSPRLVENYDFFTKQIAKGEISLRQLVDGIAKLMIVGVSLDRSHDNPQLIFESLNSTGLDLSEADLIRNYMLMGLEPKEQERLYNQYWFPMEQRFGHAEYSAEFDHFVRDYLTVKSPSGAIPNIKEIYADFKVYQQEHKDQGVEALVSNIAHYSKYFVNLAFQRESDQEFVEIFNDIKTIRVDVAFPFLIEVYDDFKKNNKPSRAEFVAILRLVESYVFRRAICGIPTNSLNNTFARITKHERFDKTKYLESVQAAFLSLASYRRFPDDEEFNREIQVKDVYHFRTNDYLLLKLENAVHANEPFTVKGKKLTIEHILPQNANLSVEWQAELGPNWKQVQSRYLHTLGNLTLTGYNPSYSDRPFQEKRDMEHGFRQSPVGLNASLKDLDHWNEEEIQKRARMLAERAVAIWERPDVSIDRTDAFAKEEDD